MDLEKLINEAYETIIDADEDRAMEIIEIANVSNFDFLKILKDGFGKGHKHIADLFEKGRISLPELIYSAEVMKRATERIEIFTGISPSKAKGKAVIATVEGDVHDIGKLIVGTTMRTYGIEVYDLGRDIPVSLIVEKAMMYQADIIVTSALLTTTLMEQKKLEDELRKKNLKPGIFTMVGGGPCTKRWAKKIGADAYTEDAVEAAKLAILFLSNNRK